MTTSNIFHNYLSAGSIIALIGGCLLIKNKKICMLAVTDNNYAVCFHL